MNRTFSKFSVLALVIVSWSVSAKAQNPPVTVNVDASANRHSINPNVYGTAYATADNLLDLNSPFHRLGGNNTTRYNWQINADNKGADWFFESIPYDSSAPGEAAETFLKNTKLGAADAGFTIPIINYIAKLASGRTKIASFSQAKYGAQTNADWNWFPDAGNGVLQSTGQNVTGNNPLDANVPNSSLFQKGLIQQLVSKYGGAGSGGMRYYFLDNEPSIWWATHRDVAPLGQTMDEAVSTILDYGGMIKSVDPNALLIGPEEWGWSGYFYSGRDQRIGNTIGWGNLPDRQSHGNWDYLPYVLDQLRQNNTSTGKRILDIFSLHYYPQGGEFSNDLSSAMQLRRNRSTRSLWDSTYSDETWIGQPVQLIPRMKSWVNSYYPGTATGITEYNWGAEGHINGATTQADIYGIFGREALDYSARWATPANDLIIYKSMQIFRNYDKYGSTFGDTSVKAVAPNPDEVSVFSAIRSYDQALTVIIVNKVLTGSTPVTVNLSNFTASGGVEVRQITTNNRIDRLTNMSVNSGSVAITVPAQSITLLVIAPVSTSVPAVPTALRVGAGVGQVDLNWRPLANATSYSIKRSLVSGGASTVVGTSTTSSFTDTGLDAGIHYFYTVSASNGYGSSNNSSELMAIPLNSLRVKCGGPAFTASNGTLWQADTLFDNGYNGQFNNYNIAGASDSGLYWNYRKGTGFSYHLPAQAGAYSLKLYFTDDSSAAGQRLFNVTANGNPLLTNFDIFATAGGNYTSLTRTFNISCNDTGITLAFNSTTAAVISAIELVAVNLAPPSPTGLSASSGNHSVLLTWQGATRAAAYTLKRATVSNGPYTNLSTTIDGAAYEDVNVTNGTTYYYRVAALNSGGTSSDSLTVSATPFAPVPGMVTGIVSNPLDGGVLLTWTGVSITTSYQIKRSTNISGPFNVIATGIDGPAFENTGLTNGLTYYYIVVAANSAGTGADSAVKAVVPGGPLPGATSGLTASPGDRNVLLTWTGATRATSYTVKRATISRGPYTTVGTGVGGPAFQDVGLTNGITYYYIVMGTNSSGNGPASAEVFGRPH